MNVQTQTMSPKNKLPLHLAFYAKDEHLLSLTMMQVSTCY